MVEGIHRFSRGNHNIPEVFRREFQSIVDGKVKRDVVFVGVDREWRTEGLDS